MVGGPATIPYRAPSRVALVTTSRPYIIMPNSMVPKTINSSAGRRIANSAATAPHSFSFFIGFALPARLLCFHAARHHGLTQVGRRLFKILPVGFHRGGIHSSVLAL